MKEADQRKQSRCESEIMKPVITYVNLKNVMYYYGSKEFYCSKMEEGWFSSKVERRKDERKLGVIRG